MIPSMIPSRVQNQDIGIGSGDGVLERALQMMPTRRWKSDTKIRKKPCSDFALSRVRKMPISRRLIPDRRRAQTCVKAKTQEQPVVCPALDAMELCGESVHVAVAE